MTETAVETKVVRLLRDYRGNGAETKVVRLLRDYRGNGAGTKVSMSAKLADWLIGQGIASERLTVAQPSKKHPPPHRPCGCGRKT